MTGTDIAKSDLIYNGEIIHAKAEKLSLTDMWKAAGSPEGKRPAEWLRLDSTMEFVEAVAAANMGQDHISTKRGVNGGTWGHWQIALAYAKYLDAQFHMLCNKWCRERLEGTAVSVASLPPEVLEMIRRSDGVTRSTIHKVTGLESTIAALVTTVAVIAAQVTPNAGLIARRGRTAGEIWKENGFPKLKVTSWFSNRLVQMGCQIEGGGCGELGGRTAKLFDPDKARVWLDNGGRALVVEYLARRKGQTVLRLVPKPANSQADAGAQA